MNLREDGSVLKADLPYLYGYAQILVDTESGEVVGKAWMGEDSFIHTIRGDFRARSLHDLSEDVRSVLHLAVEEQGRVE